MRPTGSRALVRPPGPGPESRLATPATSTTRRHQPNGRHSSGCTSRTAWTRRNGIVSATVFSSPRRILIPSWEVATREAVAARHLLPCPGHEPERDHGEGRLRGEEQGGRRLGGHRGDHRQGREPGRGPQQRGPDHPARRDGDHRALGRLRGSRVQTVVRGQQARPQPSGLPDGQVGQPVAPLRRPGQPDPQARPGPGRAPGTAAPRPPPGSWPSAAAGSPGAAARSRCAAWRRPASTW